MTPSTTTVETFVPTSPWHKASYTNDRGACVEVSEGPVTGVRDTKHRDLGALFFGPDEWAAFVDAARSR
ncbi:DUF397 domain-containing protein [Nocardiopsis sp. NPDC049922]|uniref:DUF397 domain-containing protein n=1 Tax=Nocardiopsis sp. NPDC049922 TaxID=3155157 RepID=UPI0033CFE400